MIPPPKLDDRSFNDIVEEAISMIPRYAPEWTNHNPSDPGITLIELAAWMTDLLIYRLNQVPDKNYVAFLNLLGIKLRAPRAIRSRSRPACSPCAICRMTGEHTQPLIQSDKPSTLRCNFSHPSCRSRRRRPRSQQ